MRDLVVVAGICLVVMWLTREDKTPTRHHRAARPKRPTPSWDRPGAMRSADGVIPGQMRGLNPWAEGPDGTHPSSDRNAWPGDDLSKGLGAE